jgi:4-hydroxy-3-methylbut-2-en-1-yl diphosphate synthase IspG/GcpE
METKLINSNNLEKQKQTVNKAIRICINCGSLSVHIENYGIFCKECDMFFDIKGDKK